MLKTLNQLLSDCAGLGLLLFMGNTGRGFLAHSNPVGAWIALAIILIWGILYKAARKRA